MAGPAFIPVSVKSETDTTFTLEGPAVVYGGEDLTGEYMDAATDFWLKSLGPTRPTLYDHGFNDEVKDAIIGTASLEQRDNGVWFTAEINKAQKYAKQIQALANARVLGASTGAVSHLVKRQDMEDGRVYLKSWPIAELSLTVTPAEPRTLDVKQVKALAEFAESLNAVLDETKADLTGKERDKMPDSEFAFVDSMGDGHLPINDVGHTRAAMARFNQTQFPNARVKAEAWRKILAAATRFGIQVEDRTMPKSMRDIKAASFEDLQGKLRDAIMAGPDDDSDSTTMSLDDGYQAADPTWIVATYPDHVIVCRDDQDNDGDGGYWSIPYSVADDGSVSLGEPVQVEQTYTPVAKSTTPDIHITEAHEPATKSGDEADMALDAETQNALVEGVAAKFAPQFDAIERLLKLAEDAPSIKNAGIITPDGGTADRNVKSFADYLMAVKRDDTKRLTEHYGVKAALAEDGGTTGGYNVPTQFVPQLLQVAAEDSVVRPRAYIQPMVAREVEIPALDQQTAPTAGNTSYFGGVQGVWTAEAGSYTEKDAAFKLVRLTAHKLAGYTLASNELQADSAIALEALLTRLFGGAIGWYEDYAFLRGDGSGKPLGIQNACCAISVNRQASGNDFDPQDYGTMMRQLLPTSARRAVWVCHPYILSSLLALSVGTSGFQTWVNNLRDDYPMTLLGRPVIFSEKMNTAGSSFDVLLADFSYYVIGDRQSINIASSEHYKFLNGQTTWRFEERVDGQPWLKSAITLSDASSTVSPFVYLN